MNSKGETMNLLQDEARPIILDAVRAVVEVLPDGWTSAVLSVRRTDHEGGLVGYEHKIVNEEGHADLAQPDDRVFDATWRLAEIFRKHEEPWEAIRVRVTWSDEKEKWDYSIDFEYSAEVKARIARKNARPG